MPTLGRLADLLALPSTAPLIQKAGPHSGTHFPIAKKSAKVKPILHVDLGVDLARSTMYYTYM